MGKIVISTSCCDELVVMSISDTGTGIEAAVREQMFEPFFTTKELGKGTGQGLAITHDSIVNKHSGQIEVESVVGEGSTFTVRLPLTLDPKEESAESSTA